MTHVSSPSEEGIGSPEISDQDRAPRPFPPKLQFEGGDTIIRLSTDPEGIFVLHSDALMEKSEFFKGLWSSYRWFGLKTVDAGPKGTKRIRMLDLVIEENSNIWHLESVVPGGSWTASDLEMSPGSRRHHFTEHSINRCNICPGVNAYYFLFGPVRNCNSRCGDVYHNTVRTHQYLFALLFGKPVMFPDEIDEGWRLDRAEFLANVAYYADYYGMMPLVAKILGERLVAVDDTWTTLDSATYEWFDMGGRMISRFYLLLGYYIRSKKVFVKALQRVVGDGSLGRKRDENGIPVPDVVRILVSEARFELQDKIRTVENDLYEAVGVDDSHHSRSRLEFPGCPKEQVKLTHLSKLFLQNWMNTHLRESKNPYGVNPTNLCRLIQAAASRSLWIFGKDAMKVMGERFNVNANQLAKAVRNRLWKLSNVVDRQRLEKFLVFDTGTPYYYYNASALIGRAIGDEELPWVPWPDVEIKEVQAEEASEEWLRVVGLKHSHDPKTKKAES
ncbi:MAG: hypothetical protein Q9227_001367 [Pyrenula ochraceoflavens]